MNEILIEKKEDILKIFFLKDNILIETYEENLKKTMIEDNIYVGKVQNVFKGMQAAFVNIGVGKNVFIHLKDLLPKVDVVKNNVEKIDRPITDFIKPGQPIILQVMKDASNKKGARVTCHISIKGRYVMYMPGAEFITVSQKIDDNDKDRLKEIVSGALKDCDGAIIRTAAKEASEEDIKKEIMFLTNKWEEIKNIKTESYPILIHNAGGILGKYLIDIADKGIDKIIVNNEELREDVIKKLNEISSEIDVEINENLLDRIGLEKQLIRASSRKVWLDCGGFITIDKTEALIAIDVNSGKCMGKDDFEQTIFEINKEATIEIAKQLRLRDLGGIIIVDYIDMHEQENKNKIIEIFKEEIKKDISKVQIEGFSKLNLLELTRKHVYSK